MGLITEIRKKIREGPESPELEVSSENYENLKKGKAIIVLDKFNTSFLLRIGRDKIGFDFTNNDLIIEKLRLSK